MSVDFLVIGAQKCATSWLYYCLAEHPGLHLPPRKREVEYLGGEIHQARGDDWYLDLLHSGANAGQVVGDVSVEYLIDSDSPAEIQRLAPEVKLIVSLREPVDRAVSSYFWYRRKGKIPLDVGLEDCAYRLLSGGEEETPGDWFADILHRGFYDVQLARYLDHFPPEQLLVLSYQELRRAPGKALRQVYGFLGVDPDYSPRSRDRRPKQNTYWSSLIYLERLAPRFRPLAEALNLLNQGLTRFGLGGRPPDLPRGLRQELEEVYRPHLRSAEELLQAVPREQRPTLDPLFPPAPETTGR